MINATSLAQQDQLQRLADAQTRRQAALKDALADTPTQQSAARATAVPSPSTRVTLSPVLTQSIMTALTYKPVQSKNTNINLLKQMSTSSEHSKAAARQRLQQLKDRIDAMKKFMIGLDPRSAKAMAGIIKMLAQQVKAAAAALGGASSDSSVSTPTVDASVSSGDSGAASADSSVSGDDASGDSANAAAATPDTRSSVDNGSKAASATAKAAADAGVDISTPATSQAPTATSSNGQPETNADGTLANQQSKASKDEKHAAAINAATAKAVGDAQKTQPAGVSKPRVQVSVKGMQGDAQTKADADLVRKVAAKLKELMALVKMSLRGQPSKDMKDAEGTMRDVDKIVKNMVGSTSNGGNISVDTGIAADP